MFSSCFAHPPLLFVCELCEQTKYVEFLYFSEQNNNWRRSTKIMYYLKLALYFIFYYSSKNILSQICSFQCSCVYWHHMCITLVLPNKVPTIASSDFKLPWFFKLWRKCCHDIKWESETQLCSCIWDSKLLTEHICFFKIFC